jgi:hypothetical protein
LRRFIYVMKPSYDQYVYVLLKVFKIQICWLKKFSLIVFLRVKKCIYGLLLYAVLGYSEKKLENQSQKLVVLIRT